ncbi:uncharacterized CRM domain-containing protein At3g25440, chloroplastic isoform X1 [Primulina huaijiensis]|uniref:uncharacterized CRM domain-containing protein At3g25440, chloroplastic isoform X1 n=1 Tax=Primulina huaijiensis TaxID=1492673 RepID=UPI003CC76C32
MAIRFLAYKSQFLKSPFANYLYLLPLFCQSRPILHNTREMYLYRIFDRSNLVAAEKSFHCEKELRRYILAGVSWIHSGRVLTNPEPMVDQSGRNDTFCDDSSQVTEKKRKRPKGKRAMVRWLKFFRYKKKKDYERMTPEERVLYKLTKARRKEERLLEGLDKIEPKESSETTHDPEILTPEEHFYYLKMGEKCKNYVPVGRRGIYQGVILNMHLHWKKHQTLKVIVKTFSPEEVKEIAVELARLSGGIVLDIQEENIIIMYRGKNYSQPPTEIMSPRTTLPRKKAFDKSKYRDALRAVKKYIPKLEQDLELLQSQAERKTCTEEKQLVGICNVDSGGDSEGSKRLKELLDKSGEVIGDDVSMIGSGMDSESESLSDIFETDTDHEDEEKEEKHLYLEEFDKFSVRTDREEKFIYHKHQVSSNSPQEKPNEKDAELSDLDEVDRLVLRAASLLKKKGN